MADLRELRISRQIPVKDMVAVVQELYLKYDKTVQSKCESDNYGVSIRPDAMRALYSKFAPELLDRKKDRHRLTNRISARLEAEEFEALQQYAERDGFDTMQDWITAMVRRYISEKKSQKRKGAKQHD